MIKLLAIDMDGTCLDRRSRISDKTIAALKRASDAGILIIPTTGRSLTCLPHRLAQQKSLYDYVITSNGARVTDCRDGRPIFQAMIAKGDALSLLASCKKQKLGITSHINHAYLLQGRLLFFLGRIIYGKDADGVKLVKNMEDIIRKTSHPVEELQFYFLSPIARQKIEKTLADYPQLSAAYTGAYVEVFSKNASKGTALAALAAHLNIKREEIACMGDGENDMSMFQVSGLTFAMGNAVPVLKNKADYVLPSNDEDGVAEGILRHLLG